MLLFLPCPSQFLHTSPPFNPTTSYYQTSIFHISKSCALHFVHIAQVADFSDSALAKDARIDTTVDVCSESRTGLISKHRTLTWSLSLTLLHPAAFWEAPITPEQWGVIQEHIKRAIESGEVRFERPTLTRLSLILLVRMTEAAQEGSYDVVYGIRY